MIRLRLSKQTVPQRRFWDSPAKFRAFVGGVGSGKTRAGVIECLRQPAGSTGVILAPTYPMLRDATLASFLEVVRSAGVLVAFNKSEMRADLAGGRTILFRSTEKPDRLRGPNLGWFWPDEAAMMSPDVWGIMLGRLRRSPGRAWTTSTPKGKNNWLYKRFVGGGPEYWYTRASSRSNPFLPEGFVGSMADAYSEQFAAQEIEGEFTDESQDDLIPEAWVDRLPSAARERNRNGGRRRMGVDLGYGTGRDATTILVRDDLGILYGYCSAHADEAEAAFRISEAARQWGVRQEDIVYDAGGPGRTLPPFLAHHRITEAVAYHGSGKGGASFENRRSRMGWAVRERLNPKRPSGPPVDPDHKSFLPAIAGRPSASTVFPGPQPPLALPSDRPWWPRLAEELKGLKYGMRGRKIALEPKADYAARLGRSPDMVDALMMSFYGDENE